MSALCGIIHWNGKQVDPTDLATMTDAANSRGPDGTSQFMFGIAGFSHQEFLLAAGSDFQSSSGVHDDDDFLLLADARLDNRAELYSKLGIANEHPSRISTGALLVSAWKKWREKCVDQLRGDFVFAIWDKSARQLFLARDALGARGMAWSQCGDRFVFASEILSILELPFFKAKINEDAVLKTLASMPLNEDETYFEGLYHLLPASCMVVSESGIRSWKYWDINPDFQIRYNNAEEYTDHFLDLLEKSVARRISGVAAPAGVLPIGLSLSGGYDSTLLAAVTARQLEKQSSPYPLKSFSYVFDVLKECDERDYSLPVISRYGIDATFIPADTLWTFCRLNQEEVHHDTLWTNCYSQLPEAVIEAASRAGCKILLDGMFGDALFCEPGLFAADLLQQGRFLKLFSLLFRHSRQMDLQQELIDYGLRQLLPPSLRRAYRGFFPAKRNIDTPGLSPGRIKQLQELAIQGPNPGPQDQLSPARRNRYHRIFQPQWAQGFSAVRGRPYNAAGIEPVSPYFDRKLVEFILAIPAEEVSHPGHPRKIQNNAMRRLLPPKTCNRTGKASFEPLVKLGLLEKETERVRQLSHQSLVEECEWVERGWVENVLANRVLGDRVLYQLSTYLHLELWLRKLAGFQSGSN